MKNKIIFDSEIRNNIDQGNFIGRLLDYFTTGNPVKITIERLDNDNSGKSRESSNVHGRD